MDNINDTSIQRKNKHLNVFERGQIQLLHNEGLTPYAIGKKLGRASNTIRNELSRGTVTQIKANKVVKVYYPDTGQAIYERNRANCGAKFKFLSCSHFIRFVETRFYENTHSIDAICGVAKLHNLFDVDKMVCTKTLYNYINLGLLGIANIDLPLKVKRSTKRKRIRKHKKILGRNISERPVEINDRSEFGHWEIDSVIGKKTKGEPTLMTITERKTRKELIRKIPDQTSESIMNALKILAADAGNLFSTVFKSITADNGSEFADLSTMEEMTGTRIYFAHPYTSSERGTNERHNGLIRRFIPKGKSLLNYSVDDIAKIQNWCNTLPRKILKYLTPDEAFNDELYKIQ
ncbi:IS30 family transposase [Helicovermis profundi]|uniref:IS30 family transposase n=1 Tax=Helicovermis profundi TaxID=3065157 RepID=A0AAU9ECQ0_9FIRM|nr:IS30 family transposase [Clostridia bacterium S502]